MKIRKKTLKKGGTFMFTQITALALILNLLTPFFYANAVAGEDAEVIQEISINNESNEKPEEPSSDEVVKSTNAESKGDGEDGEKTTEGDMEETASESKIEEDPEVPLVILSGEENPEDTTSGEDQTGSDESSPPESTEDKPKEEGGKSLIEEVVEIVKEAEENEDGSVSINVEEGREYEYEDLKIKFTRVDSGSGRITVKKIELTDEQVKELNAISNTAWDITSDMENGTFEYELTLPFPEKTEINDEDVSVIYLEEEEDLSKLNGGGIVKNAEEEDEKVTVEVDAERNAVEVKNLDHFTVYIVATYSDVSFTVLKDEYFQGETVYAKADNLHSWLYYRLAIDPPGRNNRTYISKCIKGDSTITGEYQLGTNAKVSTDWEVELHGFSTEWRCKNTKIHLPSKKSEFEVKEYDYQRTRICHATGQEDKFISNTPATIGVLMGHVGAHHQQGRDIIPPLPPILPIGQNWDLEG